MINYLKLFKRNLNEKVWKIRGKLNVPGTVYGHGLEKSIPVKLPKRMFANAFDEDGEIYHVHLNGKEFPAKLAELQRDPVTHEVLHFSLQRLPKNAAVTVKVPVKLKGKPEGVKQGGTVIKFMEKLKVKAKVDEIPDTITADIGDLEIGDVLKVEDIEENVDVNIKNDDKRVVATIRPPSRHQAVAMMNSAYLPDTLQVAN